MKRFIYWIKYQIGITDRIKILYSSEKHSAWIYPGEQDFVENKMEKIKWRNQNQ